MAVDSGRLATIDHDQNSRRKLLADQRLKDQMLSEALRRSRMDRDRAERTSAEIRAGRARRDQLRSEQEQALVARRDVLGRMAAERDQFLRVVAAARELIGGDPVKPQDGPDAGGRRSSPSPASSRGTSQDPSTQPYARRLDELVKAIRSEKVPVDLDRGLIWVDATIDGTRRLKVIVEPKAEDLRLAAATAAESGIRPIDGEPTVAVETLDGRTLVARRARIDSVQLGSYVLHDVECLVLPPEFGASPPLLGGGLLKRFATSIDPNAGTMSLTQLIVKPIFRGGEPRR